VNLAFENYTGAVKSFQKMRDVAEDFDDVPNLLMSYFHLGRTLQF
jgi:hypothetical protein